MYNCIEMNKDNFNYLYRFCDEINDNYVADYVSKQYDISEIKDKVNSDYLIQIVKDSIELLQKNKINNNVFGEGIIEYHCYYNGNNMPFGIHQDDFGGVNYTVNTVIYYLNKTVDGGNLIIYSEDDETKIIDIIDVKPSHNKIKIVIMEGNIFHNIELIQNEGIRECVVVQIKCKRF